MNCIIASNSLITEKLYQATIKGTTQIGRSTCEINDLTVDLNHLEIKFESGKWIANNMSTFGSYLRIPKNVPTRIKYGIYVIFGVTWMKTDNPNSIEFIDEHFRSIKTFVPVKGSQYTLGRGNMIESIQITTDGTISDNHAKITFLSDEIEIIDWKEGKGSTNGTYISIQEENFEIPKKAQIRIGTKTWVDLEQNLEQMAMMQQKAQEAKKPNKETVRIDKDFQNAVKSNKDTLKFINIDTIPVEKVKPVAMQQTEFQYPAEEIKESASQHVISVSAPGSKVRMPISDQCMKAEEIPTGNFHGIGSGGKDTIKNSKYPSNK